MRQEAVWGLIRALASDEGTLSQMWREVQPFVSGSSSCGLFYTFRGP